MIKDISHYEIDKTEPTPPPLLNARFPARNLGSMRQNARWTIFFILLGCAALVAPWQQQWIAQETRGSIVSKVADQSGAVLPGATVEITNKAMGTKTSLGRVIDGLRITELPLAHGNPYQLIGLSGGVTFNRDPRLDRPCEPTHIVRIRSRATSSPPR